MADPFAGILSQDAAVNVLRGAAAADRIASAYLFEGPPGTGKHKTALALATAVVGGDDAEAARRIANLQHPDVRVFAPREEGSGNIPVDFFRTEILPIAQFAPFEGEHAFLLFPDADVSFPENHPETANALLKTLEEPRRGVHFVLGSSRPNRLLPTLRSRCQRVRFGPLTRDALRDVLKHEGVADADVEHAVALGNGSAELALRFATHPAARDAVALALRVDEVTRTGLAGDITRVAEELAQSDVQAWALSTLAMFYRDVACANVGLGAESFLLVHEAERIRARASSLSAAAASARVELLDTLVVDLEANANAQIAFDSLLMRLAHR